MHVLSCFTVEHTNERIIKEKKQINHKLYFQLHDHEQKFVITLFCTFFAIKEDWHAQNNFQMSLLRDIFSC